MEKTLADLAAEVVTAASLVTEAENQVKAADASGDEEAKKAAGAALKEAQDMLADAKKAHAEAEKAAKEEAKQAKNQPTKKGGKGKGKAQSKANSGDDDDKAKTEPAPKAKAKKGDPVLRITAKVNGFRRADIAHANTPTDYFEGDLTEEQIEICRNERELLVEDLS